jgi:hypothetical protein
MNKHPIAYLLVLCDELQEWLRPSGEEKNGKDIIAQIKKEIDIGTYSVISSQEKKINKIETSVARPRASVTQNMALQAF